MQQQDAPLSESAGGSVPATGTGYMQREPGVPMNEMPVDTGVERKEDVPRVSTPTTPSMMAPVNDHRAPSPGVSSAVSSASARTSNPGYTGVSPAIPPSAPSSTATASPMINPLEDRRAKLREVLPFLDDAEQVSIQWNQKYQHWLDLSTPHKEYRWGGFAVLVLLFMARIFYLHAFYIVCYLLGIWLLNHFILFLQPRDYKMLMETNEAGETSLPTNVTEEFRPFVRRLPEFKFWYASIKAVLMAIGATFIDVFDVPVFWPVLVAYFIVLFVVLMRRQFLDMKKFKYVPWDIGKKKKYKSSVSVTNQSTGK